MSPVTARYFQPEAETDVDSERIRVNYMQCPPDVSNASLAQLSPYHKDIFIKHGCIEFIARLSPSQTQPHWTASVCTPVAQTGWDGAVRDCVTGRDGSAQAGEAAAAVPLPRDDRYGAARPTEARPEIKRASKQQR